MYADAHEDSSVNLRVMILCNYLFWIWTILLGDWSEVHEIKFTRAKEAHEIYDSLDTPLKVINSIRSCKYKETL